MTKSRFINDAATNAFFSRGYASRVVIERALKQAQFDNPLNFWKRKKVNGRFEWVRR